MEWQKIVGFYNVATLKSFTKGAEACFRTQSALSHQIKNLERELDCQLFKRGRRGTLELTLAGEKMLKFTETVLTEHDQLKNEVSAIKSKNYQGILKISTTYNVLHNFMPSTIRAYSKQYPYGKLEIFENSPLTTIDLVSNGAVDYGIVLESICPRNVQTYRLKRKIERAILVPSGHPLTKRKPKEITMEDIAKYPLIMPPKNHKYTSRSFLEQRFEELGLSYKISMETSNFDLAFQYVELGLGIFCFILIENSSAMRKGKYNIILVSHLLPHSHLALVAKNNILLFAPYKKAFATLIMEDRGDSSVALPPKGNVSMIGEAVSVHQDLPSAMG
jgi:DNA-binding transcriptional LysR family regulator